MSEKERGRAGTPYSEDEPSAYWRRKQSPNINRVMGDADLPLAPPDKDCESDNFSFGQKGYSTGKQENRGTSMWDDAAWKDKD